MTDRQWSEMRLSVVAFLAALVAAFVVAALVGLGCLPTEPDRVAEARDCVAGPNSCNENTPRFLTPERADQDSTYTEGSEPVVIIPRSEEWATGRVAEKREYRAVKILWMPPAGTPGVPPVEACSYGGMVEIEPEAEGETTIVQTQWVGYASAGDLNIENSHIISGMWLDTHEPIEWPWRQK